MKDLRPLHLFLAMLIALAVIALTGCNEDQRRAEAGLPPLPAVDARIEAAKLEVASATTKAATISARLELAQAELAKDKAQVAQDEQDIKALKVEQEQERIASLQRTLRIWSALAALAGGVLIGLGIWLRARTLYMAGAIALSAAALLLTVASLVPYFWWIALCTSFAVAGFVVYELVVRHHTLSTLINERAAGGLSLTHYTGAAQRVIAQIQGKRL